VWPARTDIDPPAEFRQYSAVVDDPLTMPPADITEHREAWIDEWTEIVVR
jgi:thiamine transport system substrate-binding protein